MQQHCCATDLLQPKREIREPAPPLLSQFPCPKEARHNMLPLEKRCQGNSVCRVRPHRTRVCRVKRTKSLLCMCATAPVREGMSQHRQCSSSVIVSLPRYSQRRVADALCSSVQSDSVSLLLRCHNRRSPTNHLPKPKRKERLPQDENSEILGLVPRTLQKGTIKAHLRNPSRHFTPSGLP